MFPNLQHVGTPHYVINKDGQLTVINPLTVFQTGTNHSATTSNGGTNPLDLQAALSGGLTNAVTDSITTPLYDYLKNNQINLLVGFVGILLLVIGILEAKVI